MTKHDFVNIENLKNLENITNIGGKKQNIEEKKYKNPENLETKSESRKNLTQNLEYLDHFPKSRNKKKYRTFLKNFPTSKNSIFLFEKKYVWRKYEGQLISFMSKTHVCDLLFGVNNSHKFDHIPQIIITN